jgi:tripartite-type tricarboxylate transporter receptor subunit TctC
LAVTTLKRSRTLPDLPTVSESGVPGYEYTTWYGMLAPGAAPKPLVARLNQAAAKMLGGADLREKFAQQGVDAESSTPEQYAAAIKQEIPRWAKIMRAAGIQPE